MSKVIHFTDYDISEPRDDALGLCMEVYHQFGKHTIVNYWEGVTCKRCLKLKN